MLLQTRHPRSFRLIINRLFFRKKPYNLTRYGYICTSQALLDNSKVKVLAFFIDIPYNIDVLNERSACIKRSLPILTCLCVLLCSCAHKDHTYSQSWSYNDEAHWIACEHSECDATVTRATHSFTVSSDGHLQSVSIQIQDGSTYFYDFQYH